LSHKIAYIERNFSAGSLLVIDQANQIIEDFTEQGFVLTLRQLYYQFVAAGLLPNTQRQYNRLGAIINDARLAGHISWTAIEDRTREVKKNPHWSDPAEILKMAAESYATDKWATQAYTVAVWIEKEALVGVIKGICEKLDVPYLACRGYVSQSIMWKAAQTFRRQIQNEQHPVILHLGDHDPSGIDMSRDIIDRLELLTGGRRGEHFSFERLALNFDQIEEHKPPPNPAKPTDSRFAAYVAQYGEHSYELDALRPRMLVDLIERHVAIYRDDEDWDAAVEQEDSDREQLTQLANAARGGGIQDGEDDD
jgi:hypothetical protein